MTKKSLQLKFADIDIEGNLAICRPAIGEDLGKAAVDQCVGVIERHIPGDWHLVLDMKNSCSLQLPAIHALRDNPRIASLQVVCYRRVTDVVMTQTLDMIHKPGGLASSLDQARQWLDDQDAVNLAG